MITIFKNILATAAGFDRTVDFALDHRNPYDQDHIHVCVIELKRGTISNQTIYQCNRYIHGISFIYKELFNV